MEDANFETQKVKVGTKYFDSNTGFSTGNDYRSVEFEAEEVAYKDWNGNIEDSGTDKTLYRIAPGELDAEEGEEFVVHTYFFSKWQGTNSQKKLKGPYTPKELSDEHPSLASQAGVEVPADLNEVIEK